MRIESVILKDHRNVTVHRFLLIHDLAINQDITGCHRFQPGHHPQQGRFATARWPDDDNELAIGDLDVDPMDHFG